MTKPEERRKLVVAEPLGVPEKEIREALRLFTQAGHELVIASGKPADTDETVRLCADADYVILANMPFPDAVVDACPNLRFVDVAFTGVDHVGLNACRRRGIRVCNASGYATRAVSEQALCMFLSLLRALPATAATGLRAAKPPGRPAGSWAWAPSGWPRRIFWKHSGAVPWGLLRRRPRASGKEFPCCRLRTCSG